MAGELVLMIVIGILVIALFVSIMRLLQYRQFNLDVLFDCITKKKPVIWMEGPSEWYWRVPLHEYNDYIFTEYKEIIKKTPGTEKPCRNMGGLRMAHADAFLSVTIPMDIPRVISYLSNEKRWNANDIADFLQDIGTDETKKKINISAYQTRLTLENEAKEPEEKLSEEDIIQMVNEAEEFNRKIDEREKIKNYLKKAFKSDNKETVQIYQTVSTNNVKDFINTGINNLTNKTMLWLLVQEEKLDNMFKKNYGWLIMAGVALLLILFGLGMASQMGLFDSIGRMLGMGGGQAANAAAQAGSNTIYVLNNSIPLQNGTILPTK